MGLREIVEYKLQLAGNLAQGAKEAKAEVKDLSSAAMAGLNAAGALASGVLAAGAAFFELANQVSDAIDSMGDLSSASGLSTRTIQGLRAAAAATGGDMNALVPVDLAKRMEDASDGAGKSADAFRKLGVEVTDGAGGLRSVDDVLHETLASLYAIEDPTTRAALATKALGSAGGELLGTFENAAALDHFVDQASKFGIQAGEEAAAGASAWQAATAHLSLAVEDLGYRLFMAVGPTAVNMLENFTLGFVAVSHTAINLGGDLVDVFTDIWSIVSLLGETWSRTMSLLSGEISLADYIAGGLEAQGTFLEKITKLGKGAAETFAFGFGDNIRAAWTEAVPVAQEWWSSVMQGAGDGEAPPPGGGGGGSASKGKAGPTAGDWASDRMDSELRIVSGAMTRAVTELENIAAGWTNDLTMTLASESTSELVESLASEMERVNRDLQRSGAEDAASKFGEFLGNMDGMVAGGFDKLVTMMGPVGAIAMGVLHLPDAIDGLKSLVDSAIEQVETLPDRLRTALSDTLPGIIESIPDLTIGIVKAVAELPGILADMLPELVTSLVENIPEIAMAVIRFGVESFLMVPRLFVELLITAFDELFGGLGTRIADGIVDALVSVLDVFRNGEGHVLGTNFNAAKGTREIFGADIPDWIPRFDKGTPAVTQTGLAVVHKGEAITPGGRGGNSYTFNVSANNVHELIREIRAALGPNGDNLTLDPLG